MPTGNYGLIPPDELDTIVPVSKSEEIIGANETPAMGVERELKSIEAANIAPNS